MVYMILGTGFEEAEAIIPCDLMCRAGIEVQLVGIGGRNITGGHGITVQCDCVAEQTDFSDAEMIVLPGGLGGVASIRGCKCVLDAICAQYAAGRFVAAICAAPTILAQLGLTDGRKATCYPGCEKDMGKADTCAAAAICDGNVITGKAAGTAFDFGLMLIEKLRDKQTAERVAAGVVYR